MILTESVGVVVELIAIAENWALLGKPLGPA